MPLDPKQIMHANELNSWLKPSADLSGQSIDGVMADITEIWQKEGQLLDSGELSLKLADKYLNEKGITAEAKQTILSDIADIEALKREADHTTGVLKKDHKGVETALSHAYAQETGRPVMMLEFDFGNMGGTNELFQKKFAIEKFQQEHGHANFTEAESAFKGLSSDEQKRLINDINIKQTFEKTDTAAKIVTQTVVTDLEAHFPDNKVIAIRTGGDELRFIVEGVDPSKYDDIIMATTHNVEIKMAELGLLDHEHAKGRDNIFKNGFGGGLAAEDMRNITDPDNIIAIMDEDVKAHKDSIGEVRANQHVNITDTVKRNMGIAADTDITALPTEQQRAFDHAIEQQKTYLDKNAENIRAHAPSPAQTIAEFDARAAKILADIDKTPQLDVNNQALKSADIDGLTHSRYATIEERRVAYMEQSRVAEYTAANGGQAIDTSVQDFMASEARSLNPMDPSAGVNTVSDYRQNAQIWYDASTPDARPSTMFVGFQNLGGLNNLLGHDGADAVLKDMSGIVTSSLNEAGIASDKFVIAHNGGGEFRLVVQPGYEDQLKTANLSIAEKTAALNTRDIGTYIAEKGIALDEATQQKIAGKNFTAIEDPKVRDTHIGEQKIQGYADGLAVITASSEMDIVPGNDAKAWDVDHVLSAQKQSLDDATDNFRHQEIMAYHNIDNPAQINPNVAYTARRAGADTTPRAHDSVTVNYLDGEPIKGTVTEVITRPDGKVEYLVESGGDTRPFSDKYIIDVMPNNQAPIVTTQPDAVTGVINTQSGHKFVATPERYAQTIESNPDAARKMVRAPDDYDGFILGTQDDYDRAIANNDPIAARYIENPNSRAFSEPVDDYFKRRDQEMAQSAENRPPPPPPTKNMLDWAKGVDDSGKVKYVATYAAYQDAVNNNPDLAQHMMTPSEDFRGPIIATQAEYDKAIASGDADAARYISDSGTSYSGETQAYHPIDVAESPTVKPRLTENFDGVSKGAVDTPNDPTLNRAANTPDIDAASTRMSGFTQIAAGSAGFGMSIVGMKNALDRGDTTGIVVAGTDMAVSSADLALDSSTALGRSVSSGLRGAAMKANIAVTLVDGVYQISQEEGLENQLARGAAVTVTTGTALGVGAAATTVVAGGAFVTTAVVTAPIASAVAVGLATDAGVGAFKAQNAFEDRIAQSEQGIKTGNAQEGSGAPALQNYQNLRAFAILEASDPDGEAGLSRQESALKASEYEYSSNPEALDQMEAEIQAKIDSYDKIIEDNDSWVPDFTRFFGQDEVQTKMSAQIERTQYVAAMNELKEYREELSEYQENQAHNTPEQAEQRNGLSGSFDSALTNEDAQSVSSAAKSNLQDDITADDINVSNSIASQNGDNTIDADDSGQQRVTRQASTSYTNIAP